MNCDDWKLFVQEYLAGVLSQPAQAAIERHLSECATCFQEARVHKLVENHLRGQPALEVPAGLVDRIVDRAAPASAPRFRQELLRMAALFLMAVGIGVGLTSAGVIDRLPDAREAWQTLEVFDVTDLLRR
ncbi:MAG: zf-HC2 domain-containing protein [Planctomycetes bacterium]|nr:zf-HC2 domain-containing protein [Planctomycetota bacterium]